MKLLVGLALIQVTLAALPACNETNGIPGGAPAFETTTEYGTCSGKPGFVVPGHETIGEWKCVTPEYCQSIGGYLGQTIGDTTPCEDLFDLYKGNGVCDEFLNCAEHGNDGGDCPSSATDPNSKLYKAPVIEKPLVDATCDDQTQGCINVTVFIVDFGEDGVTSGGGFIGRSEIASLDEAIRIVTGPFCLTKGCSHEVVYQSDLFSTLHNYIIIYTSDGDHSLGSARFEHSGARVTIEISACGDGEAEEYEGCDDGNLVDGDGCSSTCEVEAGYKCSGDPSNCVAGDSSAAKETIEIVVDQYDDTVAGDCSVPSSGTCTARAAILYGQSLRNVNPHIKITDKTVLTKELPLVHKPMLLEGMNANAGFDIQDKGRVVSVSSMQSITIKGIKFENGYVHGFGALILNMGMLVLDACKFHNSESHESGGAVWTASDKLWVKNCEFVNNTAGSEGGAIENDGYVLLESTTFTNCKAPEGAAVHNCADMDVIDCTFEYNEAERDGGGLSSIGAFTMKGTTFKHNKAGTHGGGFYCSDTCEVTDCHFEDNFVDIGGVGGGLSNTGATNVINCKFVANGFGDGTSLDPNNNPEPEDGDAQNGGGVYNRGSMLILDSDFDGNSAYQGGGVFNEGSMYVEGVMFGKTTPNRAMYQSGVSYSSGLNLAGTAEIVLRGGDSEFPVPGDKPHANRIASCDYEASCGQNAACEEKSGDKIGLTCTCPATYPGGDPHDTCLSPSSAKISASAEYIQVTLIKPASETIGLQFTKRGMGLNTDSFSWSHDTTMPVWANISNKGDSGDSDIYETTMNLLSAGMTVGQYKTKQSFSFNTDESAAHDVEIILSIDHVPHAPQCEVEFSHTGTIPEGEPLTIDVFAKDLDGFTMTHGGATFYVEVEPTKETKTLVDNSDGTYHFDFQPSAETKDYKFSVKLDAASVGSTTSVSVDVKDDTLEKLLITGIVIAVVAFAVIGYYVYNKKNKKEIDFEVALSVEEEKRRDMLTEQKLNYFWLALDIFDVGTDVAALVFAMMGGIDEIVVSYIFAFFVGLSLVVSSQVVVQRIKSVIDLGHELNGSTDAGAFGMGVSVKDLSKAVVARSSSMRASSKKVHPAGAGAAGTIGETTSLEPAPGSLDPDNPKDSMAFQRLIMSYSRATVDRRLYKWIIGLMCVEDIPSFGFNVYFLASAWPNLDGFTIPLVSLLVTSLSIGYKLSYLQKLSKATRTKSSLERRLRDSGVPANIILDAIKDAKKALKENKAEERRRGGNTGAFS